MEGHGGTHPFTYPILSASDGGWTDPGKQDCFAYPHDFQTSEVYSAGLNLFLPSGPIQGIDGGWTECFESSFPPLTFSGHGGVPLASIGGPANIDLTDQRHENTPVDTMPNFKVSSNFIENSSKKGAAGPLWRARRPAGMRKVYERPFSCDICGKRYTQRQGVSRHSQAVHRNSHSCFGCDFKWSRPYQYRIHLERWHPDVDPDRVLGKSAGSRRRSTIIGRDLPQHFPLHVIESDQRSHSEPWQRPTLPLPAAANVTRISQISMLSVAYDPHPEHAEPMATFRKCENAQALEYATDIPAFSFAEECVRSANDRDVSIQRGQLQLPSPPSGGSTPVDRHSNL